MSRLGKPLLVGGTYVLRPASKGELQINHAVTQRERASLYRQVCPPCLDRMPVFSSGGGLFYLSGVAGPACQLVAEPVRAKITVTCGLPGENLPERLGRKFLAGVITDRKDIQLEAWKALITIARKAAAKQPRRQDDAALTPEAAAGIVLSEYISGKRPHSTMRYFGKAVCSLMADDYRARTAQKRGADRTEQLADYMSDKRLSDSTLHAKSTRKRPTMARQEGDREGMHQAPPSISNRPTTHEPAGWEPKERRKPGQNPSKINRWGGAKTY
jgi:hypothetical protein